MKRLIALAALLVAASACTTTTDNTNTGAANTNTNANANAAATATPAGVSQADLEAKEHQIWDAIKAKNWDAFGGLLSDDFTLVADDGVYTKAQTLDALKQYELTDYSFSDVKFVKVDDDLAVLVYTSTETSAMGGKPSPDSGKKVYNASAWANRGGKWVGVYHQETLSQPPPAGAGGNMNANSSSAANANANKSGANANTSASPAASPAAPATATDAEKAVWDALKSKNYDAFAGFLASGAMEVEPEGVTDKSGSLAGVKQFDASKFTLSDYKEVKLDSDSTLVTYVVKGPGMDGKPVMMRHSTVWNNRGGKWQAYFHMGTIATK
ncbi:MAG TPA: nuclear transport factor 2 family protein [Pyrinomonadaceae bacterium]|nr:nuclear transport factor 2 family protein [Pyrinomonadaceae bacterium]